MANARAVALPGAVATRRPRRSQNLYVRTFRRLLRSPAGLLGMIVLAVLVLMALFAPLLAPYDPLAQHPGSELAVPSNTYPLGTDEFGRDVLSRIIYGARISLMVGVLAVAIGSLIGVSSGLLAGYRSGWVDATIMRVWDTLLAFPAILLGIAVAAVLGPGVTNAAIALAIISIPQFARITRAAVLGEKQREYVQAARCLGAGGWRITTSHIFPNCISPLLVQLSLAMGYAVLLEAGLSFLGLGTQPPEPSWGSMLNASRAYLRQAPWYAVFPGVALSVLLVGLNFLSDALRDALDPRLTHLR
ncbi:MAG: ABC transporter permease [Chloroflexi bacterium]|nr:ABC transporter permease [Chloroflexota bacterium]